MIIYKLDEVKSIANINKAYLGNDVVYQSFKETKPNKILKFEFTGDSCKYLINNKNEFNVKTSPHSAEIDIDNLVSLENMFKTADIFFPSTLTRIIEFPNTRNVKNFNDAFYNCANMIEIDCSKIDVSNCESLIGTFSLCKKMETFNVDDWKVENVRSLRMLFSYCQKLKNINLTKWNPINCTDFTSLFEGCSALTSIDLSSFKFKNDDDLNQLFYECSNLAEINLSNMAGDNFKFYQTFKYCTSLKRIIMKNCSAKAINAVERALSADSILDVEIVTA